MGGQIADSRGKRPDVHPGNYWEVNKPAFNGKTYVGMVVRNNDTWERISQMLEKPLIGGVCYDFGCISQC